MSYAIIELLIICSLGCGVFVWLSVRPLDFWWVLSAIAILTGAWSIIYGVNLMDDWLLGMSVTAMMLASLRGKISWDWRRSSTLEFIVPALLFSYLILHSALSAWLIGDLKLLYWTTLYATLFTAYVVLRLSNIHLPSFEEKVNWFAGCSLLYFAAYITHWVILTILGLNWVSYQNITWGGSAYAFTPVVVALPTAVVLMKGTRKQAVFGVALFSMVAIAASLYDSRIGFIYLLVGMVVCVFYCHQQWKRSLIIFVLGALLPYTAYFVTQGQSPNYYFKALSYYIKSTPALLISPESNDRDRFDQFYASWDLLFKGTVLEFLIGYGQDQHRDLLGTVERMKKYPPKDKYRTTAFTSFAVDYGIVGILLMGLSLMALFWIWVRRSSIIISVSWGVFFWMLVGSSVIFDYRHLVLVYGVLFLGFLLPESRESLEDAPILARRTYA